MLTIGPADEDRRRALADEYGVPAAQVMLARASGREEGGGVYMISGDLCLLGLWADDSSVRDGLLRAILNAGRLAGARRAFCRAEPLAAFLKSEGFSPSAEGMAVNLADFFARPCHGDTR